MCVCVLGRRRNRLGWSECVVWVGCSGRRNSGGFYGLWCIIFSSSSRSVRRGESGCVVRLSSNSLFAVELDSMEMSSDMVSTRVVVLWELVGGSLVACWRLEIVWLIFGLFGA